MISRLTPNTNEAKANKQTARFMNTKTLFLLAILLLSSCGESPEIEQVLRENDKEVTNSNSNQRITCERNGGCIRIFKKKDHSKYLSSQIQNIGTITTAFKTHPDLDQIDFLVNKDGEIISAPTDSRGDNPQARPNETFPIDTAQFKRINHIE